MGRRIPFQGDSSWFSMVEQELLSRFCKRKRSRRIKKVGVEQIEEEDAQSIINNTKEDAVAKVEEEEVTHDIKKEDDPQSDEDSEREVEVADNLTCSYAYAQYGIKKEISVESYDLKKLSPNQYLNDSLINFFLKVLEIDIVSDHMKSKIMIMNTYFFSKLAPNEIVDLIASKDYERLQAMFTKNYPAVRRWAKEDIFSKEFLVFPMNLPEHWSLIIVCNPNPNVNTNQRQRPCLLYFDSFGLLDARHAAVIRMYLSKEYETRYGVQLSFDEKVMPSFQPLVPRQTNFVDCGLYLLEYVENFLENPNLILDACAKNEEWNGLRWFPRCNVSRKRKLILAFVMDLMYDGLETALKNYKQKRKELRLRKQDDEKQYDSLKIDDFYAHLDNITTRMQDEVEPMLQFDKLPDSFEQEEESGHFDLPFMQKSDFDDQTFNDIPKIKLSPKQRHRCLLDFYMNPSYNQYTILKP